jgi:hypothetical protein
MRRRHRENQRWQSEAITFERARGASCAIGSRSVVSPATLNLVAVAATISEGNRMLGKPGGEFYCKRGLTIEDAVRLHLKQHVDATQFGEGTEPDEAWHRSPVHLGPYQ